jgi:hypothetical protein
MLPRQQLPHDAQSQRSMIGSVLMGRDTLRNYWFGPDQGSWSSSATVYRESLGVGHLECGDLSQLSSFVAPPLSGFPNCSGEKRLGRIGKR